MAEPAPAEVLEKHLKKATVFTNVISFIVAALVAFVSSAVIVYAFYYDTNAALESHSNSINQIVIDVENIEDRVQQNEVVNSVTRIEIETLKKQMTSIEAKVDRIDEKLDRIILQTRD